MKKILLLFIMIKSLPDSQAQPYIDIASVKFMNSPDAGIINRNKQNYILSYFNASLNLPLPFRPIRGIVLLSPFYEEWNTSLSNAPNVVSKHQGFVLALSFVDTVPHHKWRYAITPIIRLKDFSEDGTSSAQWGVAGLAIFSQNRDLFWKFGCYFNRDYFGNFFMPLLGIDWWINKRNKLFGILPGNLTFEHKAGLQLYYGITFRAITNSYRDIGEGYFKVDDNQLSFFTDIYLAKSIVLNTEIGHSVFRKLTLGEKNVFRNDLSVNDNLYFKVSLNIRHRF